MDMTESRSLDSFLRGEESGFGACINVVDTVLSRLYFYDSTVVKWYKPAIAYYGDLQSLESRKVFYQEDFDWNQCVSPDIYQELRGITQDSLGHFKYTPIVDASDFLIIMSLVKDSKTLTDLLLTDSVSHELLTRTLITLSNATEQLALSPDTRISRSIDSKKISYKNLYDSNIVDLRSQLERAGQFITSGEVDGLVNAMLDILAEIQAENNLDPVLVPAIDCHADNILVTPDEKIYLIDVMFPKENWRHLDILHAPARLLANVAVLGNPSLYDTQYKKCTSVLSETERRIFLLHELRTTAMQWSRRHLLGEHGLAEDFHARLNKLMTPSRQEPG